MSGSSFYDDMLMHISDNLLWCRHKKSYLIRESLRQQLMTFQSPLSQQKSSGLVGREIENKEEGGV